MTVNIPHNLPRPEAEERIKKLLDNVKTKFGSMIQNLEEEWHGDTGDFKFKMSGQPVSGSLHLNDASITVNLVLPLIASMFKGKIQSVIEEEGAKILA